jgi:hypothetical protein
VYGWRARLARTNSPDAHVRMTLPAWVSATALAVGVAFMVLAVVPVAAQRMPEPAAVVDPPDRLDPRFVASAVVPGAAQLLAGDDRWVPYMAVEAWAWISFVQQRRSARTIEKRYRDLAWQVARRVSVGERRDTVFEYYEAMANPRHPSSGAFDASPNQPGIQPEQQPGTFNGDVWMLARALHIPAGHAAVPGAPGYEAALAYYMAHAIRPEYAWAWGASNLEQQVFADLIRDSDAAFRAATRYLGVILANHIVSTVDALVTSRLRQLAGEDVRFEATPVRDLSGTRWEYGVRVAF